MTQTTNEILIILPEKSHLTYLSNMEAQAAQLFPEKRLAKVSITEAIPDCEVDISSYYQSSEPLWEGPKAARIALACMLLLEDRRPAAAIFPLSGASAYFSCQQRFLQTGLENTKIVVIDSGTRFENLHRKSILPSALSDLIIETMEQDIRKKADIIFNSSISPARALMSRTDKTVASIGVAMAHYCRPKMLENALGSLASQTRLPDAVVVADDGSPQEVQPELDAIEAAAWPFPLTILRLENGYLGAARNAAWRHLATSHVLFMDDDNLAKPQELAFFEKATNHCGADILTAHMDYFETEAELTGDFPRSRWLPIGGHLELAALVNLIGDANFFTRRTVLEAIGGFSEDRVGYEDWEFLLTALLHDYRIEVIPEILFHYRRSPAGMLRTSKSYESLVRAGRPLNLRYPQLQMLHMLARGMLYEKISPHLDTADLWRYGHGRQ